MKDESWKTELICDALEEGGYRVGQGEISEPVIEFLCDEIGLGSYDYVALRYCMEPLIAKSMLRDMIKIKREQIDPNEKLLSAERLNAVSEINGGY